MRPQANPAAERPARSFWRDTSGAAMTEGVIVLPFFIIIFAGTLYLFSGHRKKSVMRAAARAQVMQQVTEGCPEGNPDETILDALDLGNFNNRAQANVPILGQEYIDTIVEGSRLSSGQGYIHKPGVLGGGSQSVRAGFAAECNERFRATEDENGIAVVDTFCRFAPGQGCTNVNCNECIVNNSVCVDQDTERKCLQFEGCGLWSRDIPCANNETCFNNSCQQCDPVPMGDAGTGLPCPGSLDGG